MNEHLAAKISGYCVANLRNSAYYYVRFDALPPKILAATCFIQN